ncbi:hypothetical protein LguiA_026501 [Lonicera macranthoides]
MGGMNSKSFPLVPGYSHHISVISRDDTGRTFAIRLIVVLREAGFLTLQDDKMIERIQDSSICIIIFSKDYFSSRACLDELVKIFDFYGSSRIVPVYYGVDRFDVRHHLRSNGAPLNEVAKIRSYNVGDVDDKSLSEEELIKKTVREMGVKVHRTVCAPKPLLVGIDRRANSIIPCKQKKNYFLGMGHLPHVLAIDISSRKASLYLHRIVP